MKHKYIQMQHLLSVVPHFSFAKKWTYQHTSGLLQRFDDCLVCLYADQNLCPGCLIWSAHQFWLGFLEVRFCRLQKKKKTWHSWHLVHIHHNLDTEVSGENSIHNSWHYKRSHQLEQVSYRSENFNILKHLISEKTHLCLKNQCCCYLSHILD